MIKYKKMDTTVEFRKQFLENQPKLVNSEDREALLMKAYALYYYDNQVIYKSESISDVIERYSLPKNLGSSIARLVELGVKIKKEGLGPDEYEEYEDLCDMVKRDFL